ncbi:MAG: Ig-like domain-containing protein [Bacteroidota bacterium]
MLMIIIFKDPKCQAKIRAFVGVFFMLTLFTFCAQAQTLVWEDDFNGSTINGDNWTFDFGDGCERGLCGWGNSELQYYTSRSENARIVNGNLLLEARRENFLTREFTSARLKTEGRVHFKYGTLEARMKIPNLANGLWPALWMLGITGAWPANGEIDIAELGIAEAIANGTVNRTVGAAVHWSYNGSQADYGRGHTAATNLNDDYHIYKMTWDASFIRVYIDNFEFFAFDISNIAANSLEEFHIPHFLILNLAVGGSYTGIFSAAGITAPMPGQMMIDYIKLYQDTPGSQLYLGKDHAKSGSFGVYAENTPVNDRLTYGTDANLFLWNNLTSISSTPYEGSQVLAYRANAGSWFGMGVATDYKNMSNFNNGYLKFQMKTTSAHPFRIGVSSGHGDSWINFVNGGNQYGLVRDGAWHEVSIPFSAFINLDLYSMKQMFMLTADPPPANVEFSIDNIYWSGGTTSNLPPAVSITSPSDGAIFTAPASVTISATASDSDGTVGKVDFYNGGVLLGTDTSSPYQFTWNNVSNGNYSLTAVATDNGNLTTTSAPVSITVNPSNTLPSPWQTADIGAVGVTGSASHSSGTFTLNGSGADIWNNADEFRFVYQSLSGNGAIVAQVNSLNNTHPWAKAGVMIRESLNANSKHAMTALTPSNGAAFQRRTSTGGVSAHTGVSGQAVPKYVKIERSGNTFTSSYSSNGSSWTVIGSVSISMSTTVFVGLCVTSHNDAVLSAATFNNVSVTTPNLAPTVSITAPTSGASFVAPAAITINANAADSDGSVTKVDFYNGGAFLGTDTSSPYAFSWSNVAAGNYTLTAVATDNGGTATTSAAVNISVTSAPATNLALGKTTTVSSTENAGFPGSSAVDGNAATRWSSGFSDPQWIYVDLAGTYSVNRVKITWEAAYGRDYLVQISADAANWTDLKTVTGNTSLINDHTALSGSGRYIRIYGTARGTVYGYSIFELEVYGTSSGSACSGTAVSGDYSYQVSTSGGNVNWTFVPLAPITGSTLCIIYVKEGSGAFAGYTMTASGSNFTFSRAYSSGASLTFYFTYRVGNTMTERNSSANPHSYTVGASCSGGRLAQNEIVGPEGGDELKAESNLEVFPNPVLQQLNIRSTGEARIKIIDATGKVIHDYVQTDTIDVSSWPTGIYSVIGSFGKRTITKRFIKK